VASTCSQEEEDEKEEEEEEEEEEGAHAKCCRLMNVRAQGNTVCCVW
jgi:hypothetical protein